MPSVFARLRRAVADPDVAIDLGTANTRVYARGRGLLADEPSVVAISDRTGSVEAVGTRAMDLAGEDSGVHYISPLHAGVVSDVDAASLLLAPLLSRARNRFGVLKPRVLVCAPTDAKEDEREALIEATRRAGASAVAVAPEPLAAAIGAGLDVASPYAQMLVDIGDGVTDIAVVRSGRLVRTAALRTACSDMRAAVARAVADRHSVMLYAQETERLTLELGATRANATAASRIVNGVHCETGRVTRVRVTAEEVCDAIDAPINTIVQAVRSTVNDLPAMTACEVIESGICLAGGGARLPGLAALIAAETAVDVRSAADPLRAVINGARQMLLVAATTGAWTA
jgi:rod shape-determining protein MreB and related proteins